MPRTQRIIIPNLPYHVIKRGHNRNETFFVDQDYANYLTILGRGLEKYDCKCYAYTLMPNHIHILLSTSQPDHFARFFQSTDAMYAQYLIKTHNRSGAVWGTRYKSILIDTESYYITCRDYIESNPVNANMVKEKKDYPWTSYHHDRTVNDPLISKMDLVLDEDIYIGG